MPAPESLEQVLQLLKENPIAVAAAVLVVVAVQVVILISSKSKKPFLDPNQFLAIPLVEKKFITHNTLYLRFALPDKKQRLGLPIGQHITFLAKGADGKDIYRPYTPISDDDLLGYVDFVIKIYPQGKMSQVINAMNVGDSMLMKGPKGRFKYTPNSFKHIGMVAGGTGVTPMYQVATAILKNPADRTNLSLLFGNVTEDDILIRKELDELAAKYPDRFKVYYVLNEAPAGWKQGTGFITADMIKQHLAPPSESTMVLRCGPPPMCDAVKAAFDALGHAESAQFQF